MQTLKIYEQFFELMQKGLEPLYALIIRVYIFNEFFWSGWLKVKDIYNGQWERVVYIFAEEYKIPLLSPELAAAFGTFNELVFPALLVIGLLGRFSALALFITALLIELTYQHNINHILWMVMSAYIVFRGCGWISVDYLIHRKFAKK